MNGSVKLASQAISIFNETGLTPKQLLEQRDQRDSVLKKIINAVEARKFWDLEQDKDFDAAIIEGKNILTNQSNEIPNRNS